MTQEKLFFLQTAEKSKWRDNVLECQIQNGAPNEFIEEFILDFLYVVCEGNIAAKLAQQEETFYFSKE